MYKVVNVSITEEEHQWLKRRRNLDQKFKQGDFMAEAISKAIKREQRK